MERTVKKYLLDNILLLEMQYNDETRWHCMAPPDRFRLSDTHYLDAFMVRHTWDKDHDMYVKVTSGSANVGSAYLCSPNAEVAIPPGTYLVLDLGTS